MQKILKFLNLIGITLVSAGIPTSKVLINLNKVKAFLGIIYGN
jgi:hypothetical protein